MYSIVYDKIRTIAVLGDNKEGWQKELAIVSWNGGEAKYDIRTWGPEGKMTKGATLTRTEAARLVEALQEELCKR